MDEFERGFEGFIDQMGKMILNLLCFLNIEDNNNDTAEPIQVFVLVHFIILNLFSF